MFGNWKPHLCYVHDSRLANVWYKYSICFLIQDNWSVVEYILEYLRISKMFLYFVGNNPILQWYTVMCIIDDVDTRKSTSSIFSNRMVDYSLELKKVGKR